MARSGSQPPRLLLACRYRCCDHLASSPQCSSWRGRRMPGTWSNTHPFWLRAFCSGGLLSGPGQVKISCPSGPRRCISSWRRYPATYFLRFLHSAGASVYPSYLSAPRVFNLSALQDQQCAGALMWVWVTFAYLLPAVVITVRILSPQGAYSRAAGSNEVPAPVPPSLNGSQAEVV